MMADDAVEKDILDSEWVSLVWVEFNAPPDTV